MATGKTEGEESKSNKVYSRKPHNNTPKNPTFPPQQTLAATPTAGYNNKSQQLLLQPFDAVPSDDSSSHNQLQQGARNASNGIAAYGYRKLASELEQVRCLLKKFEAKTDRFSGGHLKENVDRCGGSLARVNSDVGSVGLPSSRPFHGLSVSLAEHDQCNSGVGGNVCEFVEKEKRTPKANQYHKKSEFVLGKEKLKPIESNKKTKPNVGKSNPGQMGGGIVMEKFSGQLFKSCSNLLGKLMKHKFGWVFNKPVDVKALGLHDYYTIVKHPMDLGTVKTRLNKNWYKSPREFAEDVILTFSNAMLYNPKGQDVHIMAETLLGMFEEQWAAIECKYNLNRRFESSHDNSLPTPTSRIIPGPAPIQPHASAPAHSSLPFEASTLERSESMAITVDPKSRDAELAPTVMVAGSVKPKAKDPEKKDMTFEEKQRLSVDLQNLPSEKLGSIVQIIRKRSASLFQQEDEIEVDIDSVDPETLWELDIFVTNYKKSLSENKKNAEDVHNIQETNSEPPSKEVSKVDETTAGRIGHTSSPIHGKMLQNEESGSSSSSSDSGSSSSGSDSDSSSG
ncbi:Global transcription factor group E4 [Hibiscus syriacus]|uniref:Global transcription factor group E4 n=1 Tax=Hibiscus syriacus TaxID=106335 RepID=A0A6A3AI35_HIBSY|nr:Global transcription factor group E4 [Hibiscus syriacus]